MIIVNASKTEGIIKLGKCGENNVTRIIFDISRWIEDFGEGEAVLLVLRPGEETAYITSTTLENGVVSWDVTSTDTAYSGVGECELQYIGDGTVIKSKIWKTVTLKSLEESGESPDPESGWVAALLEEIQSMIDGIETESCSCEIAAYEEVEEMLEEIYK